jgi:predicted nucleic acid-binding Zn ribbon protein
VTQRITDAPLKRCPACRGKVTKLISNTSFQLKGSGWYVTDYARKGSGSDKSTETKASGAGKTESKSEAKTETKSDSGPSKSKEAAAA